MKDHIYTRDWFLSHHALASEYLAVADVLHDVFEPKLVIDVGCGLALIIDRLTELGATCYGIDGSQNAIDCAPDRVRHCISLIDLTKPTPYNRNGAWQTYDLVICTEVAEHLEAQYADELVTHVVSRRSPEGYIAFTSATVGQGGTDHLNEQPNEYWIERFTARGLKLDKMRTGYMRAQLTERCQGMNWMGRSMMVFR